MPGKWGGARRAHPLDPPMKTRMPGKWGGARRARPPLDPPMVNAVHQEVLNTLHQKWISGKVHYIHLCNVNKAEPTLALKPRGDVTRNPKQGYQWPQNRTCECVRQSDFHLDGGGGRGGRPGPPSYLQFCGPNFPRRHYSAPSTLTKILVPHAPG